MPWMYPIFCLEVFTTEYLFLQKAEIIITHIALSVSNDGGNEPLQDGSAGLPYNNTIYIMVKRTLSSGRLIGLRLYTRSKSSIRFQVWKPSGAPSLSSQDLTLQDEVVFTPPSPGYYRVSEISSKGSRSRSGNLPECPTT
jgi:hypothetical protein